LGWKEYLDELRAQGSTPIYTGSNQNTHGGGGGSFGTQGSAGSYMQNKANVRNGVSAPLVSSNVSSRISARTNSGKKKEDEEEERTWFKRGNDNLGKTILGTTADVFEDITAGILGIGEKTVDYLAMLAPYAENAQFYQNGGFNLETEKVHRQMVEQSKKELGEFVAKDLYDENVIARKILSGVGSSSYIDSKIQNGGYLTEEDLKLAQELNKPVLDYLENDMEKDSVLGAKSDALVQSAGQLAGQFGLSMVGVPWFVTTGVTSFGAESENALKNGASHEEAVGSAAISAGAEILSEKLFGGDLFVSKSGSDLATKYLASNVANKAWRTFLKWGGDAVGEGTEEIFSQFMSNLGSSLYREENLGEILFSEQAMDEYIESFWGGVGLGGVMGGINVAQSKAVGVDFTSGLTANEQKVVQKELENRLAEKDKVTAKQKAKIYEEVVRDMEKGRISTEIIEEVLGGEAYEKYTAAMNNKKDNDFLNSYEALRDKTNPTTEDLASFMKMEPMHKSITDYRNQTKAELSKKVSEFVVNDRLSESYRESDRRFQKYEADVTKYDEKQREIVQKAIDSGVLNNTNRSHEFVDVIAKIHAEKGVPFDFMNNAKLKESGFAIEGATVDGFVGENGITINMQSPKAWQTTVGHEITHVLEGTEVYNELQNVLFEFAESKGEYKSRYDTLYERYKEVYKDVTPEEYEAKINAEVTADLIGEYLFTDENFVNNLSATNRNVFQKIYDEIKYLCKVVTAGSKEARDIERIKKVFDKAYKEAAWEKTDTKYSISDSKGKVLYTGSPNTDIQQFKVGGVDGSRQTGDRYGRGVYLTTNESTAKNYAGDNGRVYKINADDLSIFNLNDTITPEMQESLIRDFNSADKQFRNSMLRNFRTEKTFDDFESAEKFFDHQRTVWKEQDGEYAANKPEIKEADYKTGKAVIEFTDFENWESNIGTLTGNHLYDALKSISTDDFSSFITGHGFDGIAFDEDSSNQQYVIYRNEDRLRIDNGDVKYSLSADSDVTDVSDLELEIDDDILLDDLELLLDDDSIDWDEILGTKWISNMSSDEGEKETAHVLREDTSEDADDQIPSSPEDIKRMYREAIDSGDMVAAQKLVDKVAALAGYNQKAYHGTGSDFNSFSEDKISGRNVWGKGFYFGASKGLAEDYAYARKREGGNGKVISAYLKMENPFIPRESSLGTAEEILDKWFPDMWKDFRELGVGYIEGKLTDDPHDLLQFIASKNGIEIRDVLSYYGYDSIKSYDELVVFSPSQIKSSDPVTFDDDLNWIPVTDRFNKDTSDIRYSLSDKASNPNGYATPASDLMYAPVAENSTVEQKTQLPEENSTVSETENVAPVSNTEPEKAPAVETKYSVRPEPEDKKPLTPAEKVQEYYRSDIWDRGDILSKLVNSGKTTMEAVNEATKQAQDLISKGTEGVKSIGEIFGRISTDGKLPDFEDYLHHMLNVDRCTLKERVGRDGVPVWDYTAEESQKEADRLAEENPEFVKAAEDVYAFMDYVMSVRVKSGKITQEQADRWKVDYPHYVPISRGGNADNYSTLLKFAEGDTSGIQSLDEFAFEADRAADVHKAKVTSHNFDSLMDTMVNAAFTAHWGLAISENSDAISQIAPAQTEVQTEVETPATVEETRTEDDTPSAERPPSPDAAQPADYDSIKLMEQPEGVEGLLKDAVHWVERNILDDGRAFEKIDHKKGDRNLYSHWHAIRNAFSSAQHFIGFGNEAKGVRALNDIYAEIKEKGLTSYFDMYLAHQRNIDGMTMQSRYGVAANHDFIKGVSAGQSYKEVRTMEEICPQFEQWAKDIYANTGYLIDQMVEHKMLSQDMADLFKELYPHFAPMRYTKNGVLESSLETLGQFTAETFNSLAMNDFALELKHTLRSEIGREDMDIDIFIDRLDSGRSLFDFDIDGMHEDYHTFTIYEDGERKTFDITKEHYKVMNQTRNWMDWRIPVLYQANEGFRKATTELNWIFAFTNGVKDPQEILWNSQHPLQTYAKLIPAEQAIWSKNSEYRHYYEEYLANGGEGFEYFNPNKNTFRADKGVGYYLERYTGVEAVKGLNGRIEAAPRLAEYIASREMGKSVQESMLDAAQVTVNFQAGGKLTKFLNRNGCTFLNASVQGALQHARNLSEGKQNAWKGVTAAIAKGVAVGMGSELVKMVNDLFFDDDEEYQNLPDYIKQDYYLFGKFGDGTWGRIPKGRTNATIEEAIRQVALSSTGNDEADWESFWKLCLEDLAPNNPFTDNLLAPIIEVSTNTSWYGEDIVPYRLRVTHDENGNEIEIPAVEQYDEKTDRFSVELARQLDDWFGEKLDFSPKKINYLINSYTGVIGDVLLPMGTPKAESPDDSLLGKLIAPLKDKFTTDAVLNHRVTGDFYETLEAAEKQAESSNATLEDKLKSSMMIGYNVEISDLMDEQRRIQMSDMKNSEKYERTREIKKEINALQQKALEALEDYSIDGIYAVSGDKRYNYSAEDDTWWEIKPKLANGKDNWYYQQEQKAHDKWGVSYSEFWNNSDSYADAVYVADYWGDSFYETVQHAIGVENFAEYASEMRDIVADKDKNGESISGSRKKKMKEFIYDLDIPEIDKHILFKAQYPYTNTHSYEIVKYLDENDDISYEAFYDILDELGYKVDSNGRVTWW
jgi:hypothetical protein